MVSGLLVPLIGAMFFKQNNSKAALSSMVIGGSTTVILTIWVKVLPLGLDANIFGITAGLITFLLVMKLSRLNKPLLINQ